MYDERLLAAIRGLLAEMEVISADFGPVVQEAVVAARSQAIDPATAERLYSRVLRILRQEGGSTPEVKIAAQVRELLVELAIPEHPWGNVNLVEKNSLKPHMVEPVPLFNGIPIVMYEGYVDVMSLDLWKENHRVELQVKEFTERNNREPDPDEVLQLVQGKLRLPSMTKNDPFNVAPLAHSIARKGVERPPILTADGEPKDGNRRIAAAKWVVSSGNFAPDEVQRARWVKVWVAPPNTTDDRFDAIVVALNFEDDLKEKWPEFVKARLVVDEYRKDRSGVVGGITPTRDRKLKKDVADKFAITTTAVTRYVRMVQWAEDFEAYHVDERGKEAAEVRYKADEVFQWFYEIQAGKSADKITVQMEEDADLRKIVYDLMFDVMDSGTQVRSLWKIVADEEARKQLHDAHESLERNEKKDALDLIKEAVTTADRNTATRKKIGFEGWLRQAVERLGGAPPDNWRTLDSSLLKELERVFVASNGVIEAELVTRGERLMTANG
ncbi:hypothetical protein [Nocardia caishijiensis]|uniref:hypothetical protein n=1 Tax=Nocardia caishijiensis TaxID=184756 RepID=UPI0012ECFB79|nr:hypothetical protein [Nocardia caishijiensis]